MPASSPATDFASTNLTPNQITQLSKIVDIPSDRPFASHLRGKGFHNKAERHNGCGDHVRMVCEQGHTFRSPRLLCGLRFCPHCGSQRISSMIRSISNSNAFPGHLSVLTIRWSKPINRADLPHAREAIRSAFNLATRTAKSMLEKEYPMLWNGEMYRAKNQFQLKALISHGDDNPECSRVIHDLIEKLAKLGFKVVKFLHLKPRDDKNRKMEDTLRKFFVSYDFPDEQQLAEDEILFDGIRLTRFYNCPHDTRHDSDVAGEKDLSVKESNTSHTDNSNESPADAHKHDWRVCPRCGGRAKSYESVSEIAQLEEYRIAKSAALERMEALGPGPSD